MNKGAIITIQSKAYGFPYNLQEIPDPPEKLYTVCDNWSNILPLPKIAVVGSRRVSQYGKIVTERLCQQLVRAGVCIVSGLAIGVDAIAHQTVLAERGITIAVLASGLDSVYPRQHTQLAKRIVAQGGALVSEYPSGITAYKHHFIARNRLVSGLCSGLLITEATEKSGTLHTARFALEQGRDVFVVPGNITSTLSAGTNNLLKAGAQPVTSATDILQAMGWAVPSPTQQVVTSKDGQTLLNLMQAGVTTTNGLIQRSGLTTQLCNQQLTMLELQGRIKGLGNNTWTAL